MKNKRLMGMIALLVILVVGGIIYSSVNGEKAPKTNNTTKTVKVGVLQYVSHPSLDLTKLYVVAIKDLPVKYNDFISDQVLLLKGNRVYTYTREMIEWHKKKEHKVFFISGSPSFLVSRMAKKMGVDDFCGSVYEIDEKTQTFSGKILKPMWDSVHKQEAIENFIKKYNIDLTKSYAYGDTNGDFSMLSLVGNPRAINPSKELITRIKNDENLKSKTQIIIERKNVIYKLNSNVELIEF